MIKKVIKILNTVILLFLILILCVVCYYKFIEKKPLIKICGISCLIVATGSMEPEIMPEELIFIKEEKNYEKGEIVTFFDEDNFIITHRIIEINNQYFISKGDANNINDQPNRIDNIQGKVIFHSRILGKFVLYWLKPMCIAYAVIIIIFEFVRKERK